MNLRMFAVSLFGWAAILGSASANQPAYYEVDDLGPLGDGPHELPFPIEGVRCRLGSVNGINQHGDVVATALDASGNPFVTVNGVPVSSDYPPAVGCAISDDGYVVGMDSLGARVWKKNSAGTYVPMTTSYTPGGAQLAVLTAVAPRAEFTYGGWWDLAVAGMALYPGNEVRPFIGNIYPDLTILLPELGKKAVVNAIREWPLGGLEFGFVGSFFEIGFGFVPYRAELWNSSNTFVPWSGAEGEYHGLSPEGAVVGCVRTSGQFWAVIRDSEKSSPFAPIFPSCVYDVNAHDVAVGIVDDAGLVLSPDGTQYRLDGERGGIPFVDPGPHQWEIQEVRGINDRGELAANAIGTFSGQRMRRAVRLRPTAIPIKLKIRGVHYHPSLPSLFLRTKTDVLVHVELDRPAPGYLPPVSGYYGRIIGKDSSWIKFASGANSATSVWRFQATLTAPTWRRHYFELNGVHVGADVLWVNDAEFGENPDGSIFDFCDDGADNDFDGYVDCEAMIATIEVVRVRTELWGYAGRGNV